MVGLKKSHGRQDDSPAPPLEIQANAQMLDRLSASISLATIFSVLGKLAVLYKAADETWFTQRVDQQVVYFLLISVFLIFFRGKMMHDDSAFFRDLGSAKFMNDPNSRLRIKSGLMVGYLSWLMWGPAIYFMERPHVLAGWLLASLSLSTAWLLTDIATRQAVNTSEANKRYWWVLFNGIYGLVLALMAWSSRPPAMLVAILVLILACDWLFSDPLATSTG